MAEEFPTQQRVILNANRGISNVLDYDIIARDLQGVADKIFNILKDHYGPFSGFASIDDGRPLSEPRFTKDGIGIVRAIEFASPQEDWVRKTIAYIGTKMETAVGDGTTSSMMFACAALKHMRECLGEIQPISYNQLRDGFAEYIDVIKHYTDNTAFKPKLADKTVDSERVKFIVKNQTYTASHGDVVLAEALANVFAKTPEELWDCMTYERCTYESDKRFEVRESEGQYSFACTVMAQGMLNKDLSTWYENRNCRALIMNDALRQDSPAWDIIVKAMETASKEQPLVIIAHKRMDTNSYMQFKEKLDAAVKNDRPVAVFQLQPDNPRVNDFVSLQLLADKGIMDYAHGEVLDINGIYVKFKNDEIVLNNIYEIPDEFAESKLRHHCIDGKHQEYTDYLEGVKKYADGYAKLDSPDAREKANMMYRMYAKLKYQHTAVLRIGGHALDNIALVDVVDDCMRASTRALKYGVVYGNNRSLYHFATTIAYASPHASRVKLFNWFQKCIKAALEDIAFIIPDRLYPKKKLGLKKKLEFVKWWYSHRANLLTFEDWEDPLLAAPSCEHIEPVHAFEKCDSGDIGEIVQPANADISMLERFAEVALKYVLTERIIVRGAAYVDNKRSKK